MSAVSANYRELLPDEIQSVADACAQAWQDATIPEKQLEIVKSELTAFRSGLPVVPYDALVKTVRHIPMRVLMARPNVLDVGASSGYYREVLQASGFRFLYRAVDFSSAFKTLAERLYPGIAYDVADARKLPYPDNSHDIVLNSAVIMHTLEYEQVIQETARVAKQYVIFHRTPIGDGPTRYWQKDAYGIPCLEIHFNEAELLKLFDKAGLELAQSVNVFWDDAQRFGHRAYLLRKVSAGERQWERA